MDCRISAIVTTYFPDASLLKSVLSQIALQVPGVVIVDNGSEEETLGPILEMTGGSSVSLIKLGSNQGIAAAHNRGIAWAKAHNYTHVLLMDQDSVPMEDMVERLLTAESHLMAEGQKVAAVGPCFIDTRYSERASFGRIQGWRMKRSYCHRGQMEEYHRADDLISSGMLIRIPVLDEIGSMEEGLFIDYVDIEWGLRARSKGHYCFGICSAEMTHRLGDNAVRSYIGRRRHVPVRSPLRHYYLFRNAITLYKRPYAPFPWIVNDGYRLLLKYVFYATITPPRWQHFKMMTLGIWHGLCGRVGPLPTTTGPAG